MTTKTAGTQVPIDPLLAKRWSPRAYEAEKQVLREDLIALLEAARWAPSCFNEQPWRMIVFDRFDNTSGWEAMKECLTERNQLWARSAPILIVVTSVSTFSHNGKHNRWSHYDSGAASENICLQATSMGMAAHQMGGFDSDKVRQKFGVPDDVDVMAVIAVGYPGDITDLHEDFQSGEQAERVRRPLNESFFLGGWDKPVIGG